MSQTIHLVLDDKGVQKFWVAERDDATVTTRTGQVGKKERVSSKTYRDAAAAIVALGKATLDKARKGYLPENLDEIPSPWVESVEPAEALRVVDVGGELRDRAPPEYACLSADWGPQFIDGPHGTNLWFPVRAGGGREVLRGRGADLVPFEPPLASEHDFYTSFNLWFTGHPFHGDRRMAVAVDGVLWKLDMHEASAERIHGFVDVDALKQHLPVIWDHDGESLLGLAQANVCRISSAGVETVLELGRESAISIERVCDGGYAVLQSNKLTLFRLERDGAVVTRTIACRKATTLGTWLGGSVLVVAGEQDGKRRTVVFAVHDGQLWTMHESATRYTAAYDLRGHSWLELDRSVFRVSNVARVRELAMAGEALAATEEATIARVPLHDVIIAALTNNSGVEVQDVADQARVLGLDHYASGFKSPQTPLTYALLRANKNSDARARAIATALVEAGADPNLANGSGETPLGLALAGKHLELAAKLRERGASINPPSEQIIEGATVRVSPPIVLAAAVGLHDEVEAMLDAGADVDTWRSDGRSIVSLALSGNHLELARLLLDRGATVDEDSLATAAKNRDFDMLDQVARKVPALLRGELGARLLRSTALSASVYPECLKMPGLLSELGAINTDPDCMSYLINAGLADVIRTQIAAGADPNAPYPVANAPSLPLHRAVSRKLVSLETVQALLDGGADPNAKDTRGRTAVDHARANKAGAPALALLLDHLGEPAPTEVDATAAAAGPAKVEPPGLLELLVADDLDGVRRLLDDGSDPNGPIDTRGARPLHHVRSVAAIELLLDRGAKVSAVTETGNSPLDSAAQATERAAELVHAFLAAGADPNTGTPQWRPAQRAAGSGNLDALKLLVDAGAKLDAKATTTPLHTAAQGGHLGCVHYLLRKGAKVRAYDHGPISGRKSPLHLAAARGHLDVMTALMIAGAQPGDTANEPNDFDWGGRTAVHDAAEAGQFDAVVLLLRRDPRVIWATTNAGHTPRDEAKEHPEIDALLESLERGTSLEAYFARRSAASGAASEVAAAGGFWIERLAACPGPSSPPAPNAVITGQRNQDRVLVSPDGQHSLVFRSSRGLWQLACADAAGSHEIDDAPRVRERKAAVHPSDPRFLASDGHTLFELDAARKTIRSVLRSEGDVLSFGYAGELIVVERLDELAAYSDDGEQRWRVDGSGVFSWYPTGTRLLAIKPRANVLGIVWCVADPDGLRPVSFLDEKIDLVYAHHDVGRVRHIALGRVGPNWDVERYQELHNPGAAEGVGDPLDATPNDKAAFAALAKTLYA